MLLSIGSIIEFLNIKLDRADKVFSQYIRLRDKKCLRCHSRVEFNIKGMPITHQASHYFGRGKESTRFDEENVDTLCFMCHRVWGSDDREAYRNFKIKQLGKKGYEALMMRAYTIQKKDREMAYLYWKKRLKDSLDKNA